MIAVIILALMFILTDGTLYFGPLIMSWHSIFNVLEFGTKQHWIWFGTCDEYKKILDQERKNLEE